jgi:YVTN family beta-propeller protein
MNSKKFLPKLLLSAVISIASLGAYSQNLKTVGRPSMESPHANPIAINGNFVYVTNTPSSTVDVIERESKKIVDRIHVGIDPVSIAVRPDGKEVWVSNHVSDSVSVIDSDPKSPTFHVVIATIQEFNQHKATLFDEPVGIAFASNDKAYVALSSENQIAVIDVKTRKIRDRLYLQAQDPRAITVRGNKLYVIPFESTNKTQLSGGKGEEIDGKLVTFDAWEHVHFNNNFASLGYVSDIVKHPKQTDKDLFVFDSKTDSQIHIVETLGTLLYGIAVDSHGRVFIAQTDARNDINGRAGTKKHGLKELENRPYLNQITSVIFKGDQAEKNFLNLEPLPPQHPNKNQALATPYAVEISEDDQTLVASASASDKIFTVDARSGKVLDQIVVGSGPRGIALEKGKLSRAWIYNALDNTVTLLDVSDPQKLKSTTTISLEDPTNIAVKKGKIHFNSAATSDTGTFACASCHPNGHTDQLIWVLNTPIVSGAKQIMPRLTMPVRGLRDTAPYHWDGTKGDPYGGVNAVRPTGGASSNCRISNPLSCIRQLIDENLSTLMSKDNKGALTDAERNDMAVYLMSIPYPPAPKRPYNNQLTEEARKGFSLYHIEGHNDPKQKEPVVCGNCHRLPFYSSAKITGSGLKATTFRGASDRFQITPQARVNIITFPWIQRIAANGRDEFRMWQLSWGGESENDLRTKTVSPASRFNPVWNMTIEMSTGFSGAFARQTTLSSDGFDDTLLTAMESAASQGAVVLEADGAFIDNAEVRKVRLQFDPEYKGGMYVDKTSQGKYYSKADLIRHAELGKFIATFTAGHGADVDSPQPAMWSPGKIEDQRRQIFPTLSSSQLSMTVSGRHFKDDALIYVDGKRASGTVSSGMFERMSITLATLPAPGLHLIQVQAPNGMFSNEFIFHVKN